MKMRFIWPAALAVVLTFVAGFYTLRQPGPAQVTTVDAGSGAE